MKRPSTGARAILAVAILAWPLAAAGQTNVALGAVATQSSDFVFEAVPADASRAIDGDTNGNFVAGSVSSTLGGPGDQTPFWQVDLGGDHQIDEIVIWNRTDCCSERLYLFTVRIENEAGDIIGLGTVFNPPAAVDFRPALPAGGAIGRFVHIEFDFDPANPSGRFVSLAEVQVFGSPLRAPELPLGRSLPLEGFWSQKMKTTWDGPQDAIDTVLAKLEKQGIDLDEVPYECSRSLDGESLGSIRFNSGEAHGFELRDAYGNLVTGTFKRKGVDGETIKLKPDVASEASLEKILDLSASQCARIVDFEEESTEKFLGLSVKVRDVALKGKIEDGDRFVLTGKIQGKAKWKRKAKKIGKFRGSGSTTHKFRVETSIVEPPTALPGACLADQGPHLYPSDGALLEGWVELTEIQGSDNHYLILTDDFVSILRDFEEDFDTIRALVAAVDELGVECDSIGRSVVSVELSEFAKDNILFVVGSLEDLELAISAQVEAAQKKLLEGAWQIVENEIKAQVRKIVRKIVGKIIVRIIKVIL